jgi:hypothetical protein
MENNLTPSDCKVTAKTDENLRTFMQNLEVFCTSNSAQWLENATYQGGTERGYPAIYIYDKKTNIAVVFKESTREFVTVCKLDDYEATILLNTRNLGGLKVSVQKNNTASNITDYNKFRHLQLLNRLQDLEKQGKSLYEENQEEYLELLNYRATVQNHLFWKNRCQFVLLMENFINGIIDGEEFCDNFSALYRETLDVHEALKIDSKKLEDFQPDLRSKYFCSFISFLRCECDSFEPDSTFLEFNIVRESDDLTEEQLKDSIRNVILEIQKYL